MPERYNISPNFDNRTTEVLNEVLPLVSLPEDLNVLSSMDIDKPTKPFVVVTFQPSMQERRKCYATGALRYVTMDFDKPKLTAALEGK